MKSNPIPVRLEEDEDAILTAIAKRSRISKAELIRRAVGDLLGEVKERGGKVGWIVDELDFERKVINLPKVVYDRAMACARACGFENLSDYVLFLLKRDQASNDQQSALRVAEDPPPKR